ncbi:MAG: NAD-dependent epimerase/dehydratase family protein [Thermoleophilia bacterium]|nr:NAD-dependent epimerase/dehydratase family protein [Thermoleophilia bacterium]
MSLAPPYDSAAFAGARALVTGGLGFIGSNLARRLVDLGAEVVLMDNLDPRYGGNRFNVAGIEDRVTINVSDVRDDQSMFHLVRGHDYLFNLAGQTSHMDSMQDPYTDLEINVRAQLSILESCRKQNPGIKIVFAGTRQVYGKPEYLPVDERHLLRPTDVNGINKMAGEWYHILYNNVYGIRACILRLTNTYGPRMRVKDSRQTFLGIWVRNVVEGRTFEVWGGEQLRDFTYVDDCVEALLAAAAGSAVDGLALNVGGANGPHQLQEVAELVVSVSGTGDYELKDFPADRAKIDIGDYYADDGLIRTALGWEPRVSLAEGLRRTVSFYRRHLAEYV